MKKNSAFALYHCLFVSSRFPADIGADRKENGFASKSLKITSRRRNDQQILGSVRRNFHKGMRGQIHSGERLFPAPRFDQTGDGELSGG